MAPSIAAAVRSAAAFRLRKATLSSRAREYGTNGVSIGTFDDQVDAMAGSVEPSDDEQAEILAVAKQLVALQKRRTG